MVRPRIPDHLMTEKQRKTRERNERRRANTSVSSALKMELNEPKIDTKGSDNMSYASMFPNEKTSDHYLTEQQAQAQTLKDIQTRLKELDKLPELDQTVSNLAQKFDQYFEQHESNSKQTLNEIIEVNTKAQANLKKELETQIRASENSQFLKIDSLKKSLAAPPKVKEIESNLNHSEWSSFGQKCSSVSGTAFSLAIIFLFLLLAAFGASSLIDAGFDKASAIAGSTVCELLAVISGVMYATSKDFLSKLLSGGILAALTAVLCFFSFENTVNKSKPQIKDNLNVILAQQEYEDAREAHKKALDNYQNTEPKFKTAREVHKGFLDDLENKRANTLSLLTSAQAKVQPTDVSGLQILEIALRIIGTLVLAMLTHRFIDYVRN